MELYVLTTMVEKRVWQPVAVVDSIEVAEEWKSYDKKFNDWVPFDLNDVGNTDLAENRHMPFKPKAPTPVGDRANEAAQSLQRSNDQLISIVEQLATRYKDKDIMKVIKQLKTQGLVNKTSASDDWSHETLVAEGLDEGMDEYYDERDRRWRNSHAPGCNIRVNKPAMDCDCKIDKISVKGPPHKVLGCGDCGVEWNQRHLPDCPRMGQQNLFASKKSLLEKQDGNSDTESN